MHVEKGPPPRPFVPAPTPGCDAPAAATVVKHVLIMVRIKGPRLDDSTMDNMRRYWYEIDARAQVLRAACWIAPRSSSWTRVRTGCASAAWGCWTSSRGQFAAANRNNRTHSRARAGTPASTPARRHARTHARRRKSTRTHAGAKARNARRSAGKKDRDERQHSDVLALGHMLLRLCCKSFVGHAPAPSPLFFSPSSENSIHVIDYKKLKTEPSEVPCAAHTPTGAPPCWCSGTARHSAAGGRGGADGFTAGGARRTRAGHGTLRDMLEYVGGHYTACGPARLSPPSGSAEHCGLRLLCPPPPARAPPCVRCGVGVAEAVR